MPAGLHRTLTRPSTPGRVALGLAIVAFLLIVAPTVVRASAKPPLASSTAPADPVSPGGAVDAVDDALTDPVAGGSPSQPTPGAYLGDESGPKVALVGDSLLFAAGWWTAHELDAAGHRVWANGEIGKTVADRTPKLHEMIASKPDVLVIELGTNDVARASREGTQARQDQALERELDDARAALRATADVPCVVWVTPSAHVTTAVDAVGGAEMHNRLAAKYTASIAEEVAQHHPNVTIADWSAWSADHPEWFDADGIHSNERQAGQRGMADLITQAVQQCRRA